MPDSDPTLFQPSIDPGDALRAREGKPPWRLQSLGYASFFGGPLASGILGWINGRRLGSRRGANVALVAGLVLTIATLLGAILLAGGGQEFLEQTRARGGRLAFRLGGVATFLIFRQAQNSADRLFQMQSQTEAADRYSSLWGPGFAAALVGGVIQGSLLVALAQIL